MAHLQLKRLSQQGHLRNSKNDRPFDARSKARGMTSASSVESLGVDTERRFYSDFKNRGLAPSNVSTAERARPDLVFLKIKKPFIVMMKGFLVYGSGI